MQISRSFLILPVAFAFACNSESPTVSVAEAVAQASPPSIEVVDALAVAAAEKTAAIEVIETPKKEPTLLEKEALFHDDTTTDHVAAGKELMADERFGEAIDMFRKELFKQPRPSVWASLGDAYLSSGDSARGIACLEEALEGSSNDVASRARIVRAYLSADDAGSARAHAERLVQLDAGSASSHFVLGRSYMKLNMWEQAIEAFDNSLDIEPTSSFAHNNLGYSALMVGQTELAVEHLEATIDLAPVRHYMLNNLGVAYERQGRGADALAAFMRATEIKPGYVNAIVNRDRVRGMLGADERQLAMEILEELKTAPIMGVTTASVDPNIDPTAIDPTADYGE
jgi:tetratricopeptide (TPR) repeat protein